MHSYEDAFGGLPPRRVTAPVQYGWGAVILPHLGHPETAQAFNFEKNFHDPANHRATGTALPEFTCPQAPAGRKIQLEDMAGSEIKAYGAASDYFIVHSFSDEHLPRELQTNRRTALADNQSMKRADLTDGVAQTILITEMAGRPDYYILGKKQATNAGLAVANFWGPWTAFNAYNLRTYQADGKTLHGPCVVNCNNSLGLYGFHADGAHVVMVDGSTRLIKTTIDRYVLFALLTRDGGEALVDGDY
jgi:hypothetical protein